MTKLDATILVLMMKRDMSDWVLELIALDLKPDIIALLLSGNITN